MAVLGYLAKLKRGLGLPFGEHFLHDFSIKVFNSISMDKWTLSHTLFLSQVVKQNVLLS